ncbi:response regulator [bacterium]|nr:response regulator [bacterium]MBU1615464.1 response regulator [bacterium]
MPEEAIAVLLIEDNPNDARVLQEMLNQAKGTQFKVEHSDCLSVGLKRLEKGGIKAILLDLFLPESKGIQTLIKVQAKAAGAPIVILSALDDEVTNVQAVKKGAQDYLVKSCLNTELLTRSIRYAIERKQL